MRLMPTHLGPQARASHLKSGDTFIVDVGYERPPVGTTNHKAKERVRRFL